MRIQLNVRVAPATKKRVIAERKRAGRTNDVIVEVAIENFFTKYGADERLSFYRNHFYSPYVRS